MTAPHIAQRLVRLYPRAWRARYGQEMLALLEQGSASWKDVIDLTRGAASEWIRASRSVRATLALAGSVTSSAAATALAWFVRGQGLEPPGEAVAILAWGLAAICMLIYMTISMPPIWWDVKAIAHGSSDAPPPSALLSGRWLRALTAGGLTAAVVVRWLLPDPTLDGFHISVLSTWVGVDTWLLSMIFSRLIEHWAGGVGPATLPCTQAGSKP